MNRRLRTPNRLRSIRPSRWKIMGLVGAVAVHVFLIVPPTLAAVRHGRTAQKTLTLIRQQFEDQHFAAAKTSAEQLAAELRETRAATNRLRGLWSMPMLGTQLRAADAIVAVGIELAYAVEDGSDTLDRILGPLRERGDTISLATLTPADKRDILGRLSETEPLLASIRDRIISASQNANAIPADGLIKSLQNVAQPLREQLPFLEETIVKLIPATQIIPAIAGFPDAKTYLFLLQNNTELRPTGGFIGTYGVLKATAGEITSFSTSDVYTLDRPVRNTLHIDPPAPLKKYNDTTQWFFRDSNWSPDFPTSAERALDFYRRENGPQKNFDGVIAVTPVFIGTLLRITGDITVEKITFTPENLVDRLQPLADRKELIGDMSKILMNRVLALPQRRWQELIAAMVTSLEERHLLLYARDQTLQSRIVDQHWGGAMPIPVIDGLAVVDANLASLKTDSVVDRLVAYDLDATGDRLNATATVTYTNRATFTPTTTRYRTYTRFYVPLGSQLVKAEGMMRDDKIRGGGVGTVDVSEELGQTVFGMFISVEPGQSGTLKVVYTLPPKITTAIADGQYQLSVRKQPGTRAHQLQASIRFPKEVSSLTGVDGATIVDHTTVSLVSDLQRDRTLEVTFSN